MFSDDQPEPDFDPLESVLEDARDHADWDDVAKRITEIARDLPKEDNK